MANIAESGKLAEPYRREIEIAAATAREQLWSVHVQYALELIERAKADRISPMRALSIYYRLHGISEEDSRILTHRVLVTLGARIGAMPARDDAESESEDGEWEDSHSLVGRIQKRLRGRVHPELRRWTELHTGRAEVALLQVHIEHALRFVEILKPEDAFAEAIELYAELAGVRKSAAEAVYFFALDRLSTAGPLRVEKSAAGEIRPAPLRIVESGG